MMIKSYTANSVREALRLVKDDLGHDAVIVDTKHEAPVGGRGGRSVVVTAAVDDGSERREGPRRLNLQGFEAGVLAPPLDGGTYEPGDIGAASAENASAPGSEELRRLCERLDGAVSALSNVKEMAKPGAGGSDGLLRWLHGQRELAGQIGDAYAGSLLDRMPEPRPWIDPLGPGSVVLFVGPRGAGKSTALFKSLALRWRQTQTPPEICVLGDPDASNDHRLARLAEMFDLGFRWVAKPEEFRRDEHGDRGPAPKFIEYLTPAGTDSLDGSARKIIKRLKPSAVILTLHATARPSSWREAVTRFGGFQPTSLSFTHFDESRPWWDVCAQSSESGIPLGYYTSGVEPCDEIEAFTAAAIRGSLTEAVDELFVALPAMPAGSEARP